MKAFSRLSICLAMLSLIQGNSVFSTEPLYVSPFYDDSMAVAAILKANGWGQPVVDSMFFSSVRGISVESVTDTSNGRVTALRLHGVLSSLNWVAGRHVPGPGGCLLSSVIPGDIGKLTALDSLFLSSNLIAELPPEIGNLTNLGYAELSGNCFTHLPPEIGNLKNLWYLELIGCKLVELPPEIGNLDNLQTLYLYDNKIQSLPPEIGKLKNLVFLDIFWNPLRSFPDEIGDLSSLMFLNAQGCSLSTLPPTFGRLMNLRDALLSSNKLTSLPDSIVNLKGLVSVRDNELCSLPCAIQSWLDWNNRCTTICHWRQTQRCPILPIPPCSSSSARPMHPKKTVTGTNLRIKYFDIRGRMILEGSSSALSDRLPPRGIYIVLTESAAHRLASQRRKTIGF